MHEQLQLKRKIAESYSTCQNDLDNLINELASFSEAQNRLGVAMTTWKGHFKFSVLLLPNSLHINHLLFPPTL